MKTIWCWCLFLICIISQEGLAQKEVQKPNVKVDLTIMTLKEDTKIKVYFVKVVASYSTRPPQEITFASIAQYGGKTIFKINSKLPVDIPVQEKIEIKYNLEQEKSNFVQNVADRISSEMVKAKNNPEIDGFPSLKYILSSQGANPYQVVQNFIQNNVDN